MQRRHPLQPLRALLLVGLLAAVGLSTCRPSPPPSPGEWPQFRGPNGSGISSSTGLPATWSEDSQNILWKTALPGTGNSSPIVSRGRVFLTAAKRLPGRVEKLVLAIDFDSGELLWQTAIAVGRKGKRHRHNTHAAPTPVTDGEQVFAHFGDVLASVDRQGKILWREEIDPLFVEHTHYGAASSPVLTEGAVIVAQDRETVEKPDGWLAAFDKKTGEQLWKQRWTDSCCSYTTPLVRQRGALEEILFIRAGGITTYDAVTGKPLWRHPLDIHQPVASAVMEADLLAVFSGAHNVRSGAMLKLSGAGEDTRVEVLWETNRMIPQTSSPVLYRGNLYTVVDQGIMVCYDAPTGDLLWRRRLPRTGGYRSSLIAGDGKVYALNGDGTTIVIAAGPEFRQISTNALAEGGNASPAIAGDSILIRTKSRLYRVAAEGPDSTT